LEFDRDNDERSLEPDLDPDLPRVPRSACFNELPRSSEDTLLKGVSGTSMDERIVSSDDVLGVAVDSDPCLELASLATALS
jgi:hypothetical protein